MNINLKKDEGSIIIFSVLILGTILATTLALTNIFIPKIRAVNDSVNSAAAIFAADSITESCLYIHRKDPTPSISPTISFTNGATATIYVGSTSMAATCYEEVLDYRMVGAYRGVSRAFQVN